MANKGILAFYQYVNGKTVSLIGAGVSNIPLIPFLFSCGAKKILIRDLKKKDSDPEILEAKKNGAIPVLGPNYLDDLSEDIVIRSPGIRPDIPPFLKAQENGSRITCETELFLEFVPCRSIAVTGSDGKTTTTTLISKILEEEGYRVFLGGNIGKSMLPQLKEIDSEDCICVMELSSFQLMNCAFSPNISVITNLSENHLDWHRDMDEYLLAKKNILKHQDQNAIAVLNFDNEFTKVCQTNGKARFFSYEAELSADCDGIFYKDGEIFVKTGEKTKPYFKSDEILLPGKHNVENYMAAIAATYDLAKKESVKKIANTFGGVEHRIELCRVLNDVKFYNSSIDSSPARSTAALRSFQNKVIMIAGGYDKNLDYTPLGDEICRHVKTLILCGATSEKIKKAVLSSCLFDEDEIKIIDCPVFDDVALLAMKEAKAGDVVILSPASASFDMFKNFDERGKRFKKLVSEL